MGLPVLGQGWLRVRFEPVLFVNNFRHCSILERDRSDRYRWNNSDKDFPRGRHRWKEETKKSFRTKRHVAVWVLDLFGSAEYAESRSEKGDIRLPVPGYYQIDKVLVIWFFCSGTVSIFPS